MEITDIAESTSSGKTTSALLTIFLAGFLWVGKTTFEHVGQVAGLMHELDSAHEDRNLLRAQYDSIVGKLNERTKSRFTREDADKLVAQIKEVERSQAGLRDVFRREYNDLKIEIAAIPSLGSSMPLVETSRLRPTPIGATHQIRQLKGEVASLQAQLARLQHQVATQSTDRDTNTMHTRLAQPGTDQLQARRR